MALIFYFFAFLTILFTILSIINTDPMYALFYLSASIISTSAIFFLFGAYFIGSLQIIIYAGAIIVLFIFVIMLLNADQIIKHKINFNSFYFSIYPSFLFFIFLFLIIKVLLCLKNKYIYKSIINFKLLGLSLFGPYILITEFSSLLLLSALIIVFIISKNNKNFILPIFKINNEGS